MITPIRSFPLEWPIGWPVTLERKTSKFGDRSTYQAEIILLIELGRLKADNVVISCNIEYNQNGSPYSRQRPSTNPGVSIFFHFRKRQYVLACDKWNVLSDNIYALAKHIEAMRAQERWGVGTVEQSFAGYKALPQTASRREWWQVMGFAEDKIPSIDQIKSRFKELAKAKHPDTGGSAHEFHELQNAYEEALERHAS